MAMRTVLLLAISATVLVLGATAAILFLVHPGEDDPETSLTQPTAAADVQPALPPTPFVAGKPRPAPSPAAAGVFGFGEPAGETLLSDWNIDIPPSGEGLPPGGGSVADGRVVYANECASCHGETGEEGGIGPQLVSEPGPYQLGMPRTIGSYWPFATTVYDYINRAMPFDNPNSLSADQVYAVTAYLLHANGIISENAIMDAETLPQVEMPNRPSFFPCWPDTCRPDVTPVP